MGMEDSWLEDTPKKPNKNESSPDFSSVELFIDGVQTTVLKGSLIHNKTHDEFLEVERMTIDDATGDVILHLGSKSGNVEYQITENDIHTTLGEHEWSIFGADRMPSIEPSQRFPHGIAILDVLTRGNARYRVININQNEGSIKISCESSAGEDLPEELRSIDKIQIEDLDKGWNTTL